MIRHRKLAAFRI